MNTTVRRRARGRDGHDRRPISERGFSLPETMVALGLIFTVLLGLFGALDGGIRGLLTGRQRTGGSALAKEVIEEARGARYDDVGHDLNGDPTLATDPAIGGSAPDWTYTPTGIGVAEPLVGVGSPLYPVHEWTETQDGVDYTVRVYVTRVEPTGSDPMKRLTVTVTWGVPQYDPDAVPNTVELSTLVAEIEAPSATHTSGVVDVDSGVVTVSGTLAGVDLSQADLFFPYAHAEVEGRLVDQVLGFAGATQASLALASGSVTGCAVTGSSAACGGEKVETLADNDVATAPPVQDVAGPTSGGVGTVSAGPPLSIVLSDAGSVTSKSSAQSCVTCSPSVGDGDSAPYADDLATGAASARIDFTTGLLGGTLVDFSGPGSGAALVDTDPVSSGRKVVSTGDLAAPALTLIDLDTAPIGFAGAVQIEALSVSAEAQAGPTAALPSVGGEAVSLSLWDEVAPGVSGYRTVDVVVGEALEASAAVTFDIDVPLLGTATVTLETTVEANDAKVTSRTDGGTISDASADLSGWLVVQVHLVISDGASTLADLVVEADYGRVAARASYAGSPS